ncbi:unnamed protein product [Staurois parvus]|uniref:Uncharacterized protein n=1 Tax=Staurois parvus TaxID=386267 RepID=A0ABN9BTP9_9NEOB|nr:unnamed protein product [Staurois parvus]
MFDPLLFDPPLLPSVPNPSADRTEPWGQSAHAQFGSFFFLRGCM